MKERKTIGQKILGLAKGIDNSINQDIRNLQKYAIELNELDNRHKQEMARIGQGLEEKKLDVEKEKLRLLNNLAEMQREGKITKEDYEEKKKLLE